MYKTRSDDEWRVRLTETHVELDATTGCLLWTGGVRGNGYGRARYKNRDAAAHRLAWQLLVGPIPEGMFVCHACDVPKCVNINHLWLGTPGDNSRDMVAKKRKAVRCGEQVVFAKLTEDKVRSMQLMHSTGDYTYGKLSRVFGVTSDTVSRIVRGQIWRHVLLEGAKRTEATP